MTMSSKKLMGILVLVLCGIGLYALNRALEPPDYRLPDDPLALEALEMVKNYRSRQGETLAEGIQGLVKDLEARGTPFREGDWQVAAQKDKTYVVRKIIREKGSVEWIEREYAWRVDMEEKSVRVISLAAQQLMPFENLPPLPHGDQISRPPDSAPGDLISAQGTLQIFTGRMRFA